MCVRVCVCVLMCVCVCVICVCVLRAQPYSPRNRIKIYKYRMYTLLISLEYISIYTCVCTYIYTYLYIYIYICTYIRSARIMQGGKKMLETQRPLCVIRYPPAHTHTHRRMTGSRALTSWPAAMRAATSSVMPFCAAKWSECRAP